MGWDKVREGWFANYCHKESSLDMWKVNLMYCKLKETLVARNKDQITAIISLNSFFFPGSTSLLHSHFSSLPIPSEEW